MRTPITFAALAGALGLLVSGRSVTEEPTLEETRISLGKWIETQQIISRERNDWQQGKEILLGRLELVRKETSTLDQGIRAAQARIAETELRRLHPALPEPVQAKIQLFFQRMPADAAALARVSLAERYQNVLAILNELDKASGEFTINFEVRTLSDGKPSEVKAIYVGLTQAYYVNAKGEAGIGRPSPEGWKWEPAPAISGEVLLAFEILQGKHTPEFVPLPVKLP